jgi:hypothetical protein
MRQSIGRVGLRSDVDLPTIRRAVTERVPCSELTQRTSNCHAFV